jgi:hypothetical protein
MKKKETYQQVPSGMVKETAMDIKTMAHLILTV